MKIVFITICLDGMPWIASHYWEWQKLTSPWEWRIIEGVAAPVADTAWIRPTAPRLSEDGTTQFLTSLADLDSRVILFRKSCWPGKTQMLNEALKTVDERCLLIQVDHDERWTAEQIVKLRQMFIDHHDTNSAYFRCRYFVGPNIVIGNIDGESFGNHHSYEWLRAWRYDVGMKFETHEPPKMSGLKLNPFPHMETARAGLVFDHFAWATEAQVKWKCNFYGSPTNPLGEKYLDGVAGWKRLQENRKWPVTNLAEFLPWVGAGVTANKI